MPNDLRPIGEFLAEKVPNAVGQKPALKRRPKKPRHVSKADVREVVFDFVARNSTALESWLTEIYQNNGEPNAASAEKAFYAMTSLLEYSLPKLQRREVTGADEGPVEVRIKWSEEA